MTKEQFDKTKSLIEDIRNRSLNKLAKEYALSNASYSVGDTISDGTSTIMIENIQPYMSLGDRYPTIRYYGPMLKKNGKRFKNNEYANLYQEWVTNEK